MSDNQRRAFCRILFFCICILPTTVVGYWICHPQTASGWELAIQAQLGVTTTIDQVETPGPYETILRNVEFTDPIYGQLFKASEVRISFFDDKRLVEIPHKVQGLTNRGLTRLISKINEQLLRSHGAKEDWMIVFGKETIIEEADAARKFKNDPSQFPPHVTLANLKIHIGPSAKHGVGNGNYAKALFNIVGAIDESAMVEFQISQTEKSGHTVLVQTNDVRLPCWLVAETLPMIPASFGGTSTFFGEFEVAPGFMPSVKVDGTFEKLDLQNYYVGANGDYPKVNLNCAFLNGNRDSWNATLLRSREEAAIPIPFEDMQESRKGLNPYLAIGRAWSRSQTRTARNEPN